MKNTNKMIIIIFVCLLAASANATGFIFDWEPFVIDEELPGNNPDNKTFINHPVPTLSSEYKDYGERDNFLLFYDKQQPFETRKTALKSFSMKLDISSSPVFMDDKYKLYSDDDEKISNFVRALISLIYDDAKIKSLETIGKTIEPHINFYFEF